MRAASDHNLLCIGDQFDQMTGTGVHAFAAGFTRLPVHRRNPVDDMYGVERAGFHTASISQTAIGAGLCPSSGNKRQHLAVSGTGIYIILCCFVTGSRTFYKSSPAHRFHGFLSHNTGNDLSHRIAAYGTSVYRRLSFGNSCGKTVAAWISAAAAVVPGKSFSDRDLPLVCLHREFLTRDSEKNTDKEAHGRNYHSRYDNRFNIHIFRLLISVRRNRRTRSPSVRL